MLKKTAAILCLSSILVTVPSVSFANERVANDAVMMVRGVENQGITVNISPEARGQVTTEEISQIIKQAGNATNITIHRVNKKETFAPMKVSNIVKKVESRDNPTSAVQIISVPKGKTVKLTKSEATKVNNSTRVKSSVSVSAGPNSVGGEVESTLTREVSKSYTVEETWTGPPESSSYISRVYYWTGFYTRGTWTAEEKVNGKTKTYKGTYIEPTHDLEWSRDVK